MSDAYEPDPFKEIDELNLRIEALEGVVKLLIGLLQGAPAPGLPDAEAKLRRWMRAEAPRSGAEPPSRQWQLVVRMAALLEDGRDPSGDGLIPDTSAP